MNRHWLTPRLRSWGDKPALIWRDKSRSFNQLCDDSDAWLRELEQKGVKPGDTLAICGDYSPKLCALLLAAVLNRNIIVPLGPAHEAGAGRVRRSIRKRRFLAHHQFGPCRAPPAAAGAQGAPCTRS